MKLQKPFCRLPVRFDAERLREEIEALPASAWSKHPSGYAGNTALRLISAQGGDNDDTVGEMKPTAALTASPYLQQVLGSFGVVWSRSRLMKLAAHGHVPRHSDTDYHWHYRVRIHIPVVTFPEVKFTCGTDTVHMAAGEAWIFDNWRTHTVHNGGDRDRIHLVADTMGNERFWDLARRGQWDTFDAPQAGGAPLLRYQRGLVTELLFERFNQAVVMPPAEVEALVGELSDDLMLEPETPESARILEHYRRLLKGFCSEWRQLWSLFGDLPQGQPHFAVMRQQFMEHLAKFQAPITLRSNGVPARSALRAGVLMYLVKLHERRDEPEVEAWAQQQQPAEGQPAPAAAPAARPPLKIERPIFIVAAPRSGSTLLFETLQQSGSLWSLGGEAHHLVEQFPELRPNKGAVDSNRLTAAELTPEFARKIRETIESQLTDVHGRAPPAGTPIRILEKTPKNALRIPLFRALFPDAQFIYLWRDPRENLGSIIEAWRSGKFVTYRALPGATQPWSLLLPPGWQQQLGRPLEEIAAFQWRTTHETILQDLAALPEQDWLAVNYAEFLADPETEVRRICTFAGLPFDEGLQRRVSAPLPMSKHTTSAPKAGKWRQHETEIMRVLPGLEPVWKQLRGLQVPA